MDAGLNNAAVLPGFAPDGSLLAPTPIVEFDSVSCDNELYVKRDDLIPFSFGGNKARIAQCFFADALAQGCNAVVAYGSTRSNLARVMANGAARMSMPCIVVSPAEEDGSRPRSFNAELCSRLGAQVRPCQKGAVAQAVEAALDELRERGFQPYYIYGDRFGKGNEATPVQAYVHASGEVADWERASGAAFDYVFLATGTGMTQAGLLCGNILRGSSCGVVGVSVARSAEAATEHIEGYCRAYLASRGVDVPADLHSRVCVSDEFLHGGYGRADAAEQQTVRHAFAHAGMPLDETYVGKGFDGMLRYLRERDIRGKRILFLHTGGTPLFFDALDGSEGVVRA